MTPSRPRLTALSATLAMVMLPVLSACSVLGDEPKLPAEPLASGEVDAPAPPDALAAYYDQDVDWRRCRGSMECGSLEVPLDYAAPGGERITLSLLRIPATDEAHRIGALVVNPGGPGGSGVEYAARAEDFFGAEVRAAFDIVGFDPRGVGESTPVDCLSDDAMDEFLAFDPDPESLTEGQEAEAKLAEFGKGCLELSGDLPRHMSTVEAARDIDLIRAALDQPRLAYFGASYGTLLGATYAELFPERVGRLVLDGAIDPTLDGVETSLVQARGFETALRAYVENCVDEGDCFLGRSADDGLERIRGLLDALDSQPIAGEGGRELTQGLAVLGIWAPLYDQSAWPLLDRALKAGLAGDGSILLSFADQYVGRGPEGYIDNSTEALYAVNCLDRGDSVPLDEVGSYEDRFVEASPTFGRIFAFGLTACGAWPVEAGEPLTIRGEGAAPILVVGTSRDPATPLAWAEALADQLASGVLLRRDGDGHTAYRAGNDCVDDTVERYLVSGEVPEGTVDC